MLKQHKNMWLGVIQNSGIDPLNFDFQEQGELIFIIQFRNSPLMFRCDQYPDNFDTFKINYSEYKPSYPLNIPTELFEDSTIPNVHGAQEINGMLHNWLRLVVGRYITEQELPDLWSQLQNYSFFGQASSIQTYDLEQFTPDEKAHIRQGLQEFEKLLIDRFDLVQEELKMVNERLDYLNKAVDRLNRFDWKAQLLSTLVSIAINLGFDTETGRMLVQFLQQTISPFFIPGHHLPGGPGLV
jgi:hypothetical protein